MNSGSTALDPDDVPNPNLDVRVRNVRGTIIIGRGEHVFELSTTAADMWRLMDGRRTIRDVAAGLQAEYGIDLDTAVEDVIEALVPLVQADIVGVQTAGDLAVTTPPPQAP